MSIKIYHGGKIAEMDRGEQKTLKTGGKYVPNDIVVDYTEETAPEKIIRDILTAAAEMDHCTDSTIGCQYTVDQLKSMATAHLQLDPTLDDTNGYSMTNTVGDTATAISDRSYRKLYKQINRLWFSSERRYPAVEAEDLRDDSYNGYSSNLFALVAAGKTDVKVENCLFENVLPGNFCGGSSNVTIKNCYIIATDGIHFSDVTNVTMENCTIICNDTGFYKSSAIYCGKSTNGITIKNCKVIAPGVIGKAIRFGNASNPASGTVENCYFAGVFSCIYYSVGSGNNATLTNITADLYGNDQVMSASIREYTAPYVFKVNSGDTVAVQNAVVNMDVDRGTYKYNSRPQTFNVTWNVTPRDTPEGYIMLSTNGMHDVSGYGMALVNRTGADRVATGTFTTESTAGYASVQLGFVPDVIRFYPGNDRYGENTYEMEYGDDAVTFEATTAILFDGVLVNNAYQDAVMYCAKEKFTDINGQSTDFVGFTALQTKYEKVYDASGNFVMTKIGFDVYLYNANTEDATPISATMRYMAVKYL